jgi:hypothetical protein
MGRSENVKEARSEMEKDFKWLFLKEQKARKKTSMDVKT